MKKKNEKFIYATITLLRSAVNVYFGQFLVFYFFTVANYEIAPIVTYYIFEYAFLALGFFMIRHSMKSHNRLNYYRIGIALQALYLALIMLLKENIIHYAAIVGLIQGLGEGLYYFPHNVMYTDIVSEDERQKYSGIVNFFSNIISIVLPLVVGYALTFFSYVDIAKVVFSLMVIIFLASLFLTEEKFYPNKSRLKEFFKIIKKDKDLKKIYLANFAAGLTFSSGALNLVVTVFTIFEFETSLNLGIITSVFAILTCLISLWFGFKLRKSQFTKISFGSAISYSLGIFLMGLLPCKTTVLFYYFNKASAYKILSLILDLYSSQKASMKVIKDEYKTEFYLVSDLVYGVSRVFSYIFVLVVTIIWGLGILKYTLLVFAVITLFYGLNVSKLWQNELD